jgi:hypothetical protein
MLYCLLKIGVIESRRMRWWDSQHGKHGEMRNAYKILIGKIEEKRPLGKSKRR